MSKNIFSVSKGFTLIELLVVVLIIGILAAVALPQYQTAVLKSKVAAQMPIIKAVADAQARYFLENGKYTTSLDDLDIDVSGTSFKLSSAPNDGFVFGGAFPATETDYAKIVGIGYRSENGFIHCEVRDISAIGQRVCLALGGKKVTCASAVYQGAGTWYCYKL